jgi:hypothetical protein
MDAPPEVLFVDVDSDRLECQSFYSEALSRGALREKNVKRLEAAIDRPWNVTSVPREFMEGAEACWCQLELMGHVAAFPSGRFRPLSAVLAGGRMTGTWWPTRSWHPWLSVHR